MSNMAFDPAYEFNAPRFYDFAQVETSGEGDSFFDKEGALFQPSPEKPVKGKKHGPAMGTKVIDKGSVKPAVSSNGHVLAKAMRALRLTNGEVAKKEPTNPVGENKEPAKPEPKKNALTLPSRPRHIRQPSPTVGVKKCKPQSPTKPMGFALQTEQRARLPRKRELFGGNSSMQSGKTSAHGSSTSVNVPPTNNAAMKPVFKVPFPKASSQENVRNVESAKATMYRRSALLGRRPASAEQITEKQPPAFKARPAPPKVLPAPLLKGGKPVTQPRPFSFCKRTNDAVEQPKDTAHVRKYLDEHSKSAQFHARPMPDFSKSTFCVKIGLKHATAPEPIILHTERRAEKRKAFDDATKKRDEEIKEEAAQKQSEKRRLEEEEIRKLRKTLVHHPLPIKMSKPMEVKRGTIATTKPETPKFLIEQRLKQRSLRPQNGDNGTL